MEDAGEVAVFSVKRLECRRREDLIESTTLSHDAQVVRLELPELCPPSVAKSEDWSTAPQYFLPIMLENETPKDESCSQ